jgi:hypothetical protein
MLFRTGKSSKSVELHLEHVRLVASDLYEISLRQGRTLVVKSKRPSGPKVSWCSLLGDDVEWYSHLNVRLEP